MHLSILQFLNVLFEYQWVILNLYHRKDSVDKTASSPISIFNAQFSSVHKMNCTPKVGQLTTCFYN